MRDPESLGLFGTCLDTMGIQPECERGYQTLVVKFAFFSQLILKRCILATV